MENNNKNKQLVEFLNNVASFYRKDTSEFYFDVWVRCLANYDMEIIRKAFDSYATNPDASGFMPSTNEILREILGTSTDSSELAWGKALKAIGRAGKSNDVVFDDALIHVVVEDMGMDKVLQRHRRRSAVPAFAIYQIVPSIPQTRRVS